MSNNVNSVRSVLHRLATEVIGIDAMLELLSRCENTVADNLLVVVLLVCEGVKLAIVLGFNC